MKLNLTVDMKALKLAAEAQLDGAAETIRGSFITLGSGQAMVYSQKEKEAEMVAANPGITAAEVPHIANEATAAGITLLDQAAIVLTMANKWRDISSRIEIVRLDGKAKMRAATTPAAVAASIEETKALLAGFGDLRLA
jgi:hypothetical protein